MRIGISNTFNPNRDLNQATALYEQADTVAHRMLLGRECLNKGMYQDAREMFESSLTGVHAEDPDLMLGLAEAEFGLGNPVRAKELLDELIRLNPDFKHQEGHLLYARCLVSLEQWDEAEHEFEVLHTYYSGPQAKYYFAKLLEQKSEPGRAMDLYQEILKTADRNRHYRGLNKPLITETKAALKRLNKGLH